ncbi:four helix bundle protein [Maribacter sp. ACAM166]|uniref:four helix bundle protein n=1 Tax=Maribacter sp. ACAM166 TaxID=2508996 RepID=UPI0010FE9261|nr:four helix bundle protein [Maribacter sp. ACAM166]TLP74512.1 four helix bundle protein [Maribacter sp. ACAM166]
MQFQDLLAYKKFFALAMKIYHVSKSFLKEEKYSLTDQVRRSSRSVSANIAEAYRKRRYPENSETQTWLEFALECNYLDKDSYQEFFNESEEVGKLLNYMNNNPLKFGSENFTAN